MFFSNIIPEGLTFLSRESRKNEASLIELFKPGSETLFGCNWVNKYDSSLNSSCDSSRRRADKKPLICRKLHEQRLSGHHGSGRARRVINISETDAWAPRCHFRGRSHRRVSTPMIDQFCTVAWKRGVHKGRGCSFQRLPAVHVNVRHFNRERCRRRQRREMDSAAKSDQEC